METILLVYVLLLLYVISTFISACMSIQAGVELMCLIGESQKNSNIRWIVWHSIEAVAAVSILVLFPLLFK